MNEHDLLPKSVTRPKVSKGFLISVGILAILAVVGKPVMQWGKFQYDAYKASITDLTASETKYQELRKVIQANQHPNSGRNSGKTDLKNDLNTSEKIFQTALSRDLLGRSSLYEPNTSNGKLACARMVNMVLDRALGHQVGQNTLYVPSIVADLDKGQGKRIDQK